MSLSGLMAITNPSQPCVISGRCSKNTNIAAARLSVFRLRALPPGTRQTSYTLPIEQATSD